MPPHIFGCPFDAIDSFSGRSVDISALSENFHQGFVSAEFGGHPEFDLGVVGGKQHVVFVSGHEGFANLPAHLGADGDVLHVGAMGLQAAGGGNRRFVVGMDAAGGFEDRSRQLVDVGRFQFRTHPVEHHLFHNFMFIRQPSQDLLRGLVLFGPCSAAGIRIEFEFVEENVAQLPGGVEIEVFSRELEDLLPGPIDFAREPFG